MSNSEKWDQLIERMKRLGIHPDDILEKFIRGSGNGGQKINTSSNCVYLKHLPTGIEVRCQADRSREMNRFTARKELCARYQEMTQRLSAKEQQAREKIRRQKRRRSRRSRNRMLDDKARQAKKKQLRRPPTNDS